MKHLLISMVCLLPFVALADDATDPGSLRLYCRSGEALLPVEAIDGDKILVSDGKGERVEIRGGTLFIKGSDKPSLATGYSPADYLVQRSEWDHHADTGAGEIPYYYAVEVAGLIQGDGEAAWGEFDLTKVWTAEELADPQSHLLVIWHHPDHEWNRGVMAYQLSSATGIERASMRIKEAGLAGYPHVMLWRAGGWIPPRRYADAVAGSIFAALHNDAAVPGKDLLIEATKATDPVGLTWLQYAAAWGKADWIREWVTVMDQQVRIPRKTLSPMTLAAMHGHAHVIKDLVAAGVRLSELDNFGYEPGHFAVMYGHRPVVATMLELGYSPNSSAKDSIQTPLGIAFTFGFDDIFALLREKGGRFRTFNSAHADDFVREAAMTGKVDMLRFIIEKGGDVNAASSTGWKPLNLAVRSGNPETVKVLLEAKADPDAVSGGSRSAMWDAIVLGEREMVRLLLENGALHTPVKDSPIGYVELATFMGDRDTVRELMDAGVQCSMKPEIAPEILVQAVRNDIPEMAQLAFGQCVQGDFVFYDRYPMDFVVAYYAAAATREWWDTSGFAGRFPEPEFAKLPDLDAPPKLVAGRMPDYDENLFKRFGKFTTRVEMVINDDGRVLFPKLEESLPSPLKVDFLAVLSTWRFAPPTVAGKPARIQARLPVVFDLPDELSTALELQDLGTAPKPIERPAPYYPTALISSGTTGFVLLEFVIDDKGQVRDPRVLRTTHPLLSVPCLKAVAAWTFEPGTRNGKPVHTRVRQPIPFKFRR